MTQILNYLGVIFGLVSITIAILTNSDLKQKFRRHPNSISARLYRFIFRQTRSVSKVPVELEFGKILLDSAYQAELSIVAAEISPRTSLRRIKEKLSGKEKYKFQVSEVSRSKIAQMSHSPAAFFAAVLLEFGSHMLFLREKAEYERVTLPLRYGYLIDVSKRGKTIYIDDLRKLDVEVCPNTYWRRACDTYSLCKELPFRKISDPADFDLATPTDIEFAYLNLRLMYENFLKYAAIARVNSSISEEAKSLVGALLIRADVSMQRIDDEYKDYCRGDFDSLNGLITNAEALISVIHKGIMGSLNLGKLVAMDTDYVSHLADMWNSTSQLLKKKIKKPAIIDKETEWREK